MPRMSIGDAAAQLNVSIDTIRRRVRSGSIKAQRDARGQWWLDIANPQPKPQPQQPAVDERLAVGVGTVLQAAPGDGDLVGLLREQIADLRRRLDASEGERREDATRAAAERDRLYSLIDGMIAAKR